MTPRKIEYAREKENILFDSLITLATSKQEELRVIINYAIDSNRQNILDCAESYIFSDVDLVEYVDALPLDEAETKASLETLENTTSQTVKYAKDYKKCVNQINELVMQKINIAITSEVADTVEILKENYIGTLKRCLKSLEDDGNSSSTNLTSSDNSLFSSTSTISQSNTSLANADNINSASKSLQQVNQNLVVNVVFILFAIFQSLYLDNKFSL